MTAPDPTGCEGCGSTACQVPRLRAIPFRKRTKEDWAAIRVAVADCLTRPAVDWRAECATATGELAAARATEAQLRAAWADLLAWCRDENATGDYSAIGILGVVERLALATLDGGTR